MVKTGQFTTKYKGNRVIALKRQISFCWEIDRTDGCSYNRSHFCCKGSHRFCQFPSKMVFAVLEL